MLNVFTMRTKEIGLDAASDVERYGLVFHSSSIITAGNFELQGKKKSYLKSSVLGSIPQSWHSVSGEHEFE